MIDASSRYRIHFLNQYAKVPDEILDRLRSLYPSEYESVRRCIGLIIVNLLEFDEVAYSRNKNFYTANRTKNYTYANMLNALEITLADGYAIKFKTGFHGRYSSTLKAGSRLSEFSLPDKIELDLESLPLLTVDGRPIFENEDLNLVKARSAKASLESHTLSSRLERIYEEALRLNRDYWNKIMIDIRHIASKQKCFNRIGLTRIFKNGLMGRWFQKGEMSYQQLPEEDRSKLLINGERVTELDYSAMHPHILYAWENKQCPDDFYERIVDKCDCNRFIAKWLFLISINADSYKGLVAGINNNKRETERANRNREVPQPVLYNEIKKYNIKPKEVVEAIRIIYPEIAEYIYSASANKLMLVESDIMTSVLLKLMDLNIPALPVHDSVIVPTLNKDVARQVMLTCPNSLVHPSS